MMAAICKLAEDFLFLVGNLQVYYNFFHVIGQRVLDNLVKQLQECCQTNFNNTANSRLSAVEVDGCQVSGPLRGLQ